MHASYAAKVHVLHGEKLGNTYHSKNCFVVGGTKTVPTPEQTAELRAKWVAIGGSPMRKPTGNRHTVRPSDIFGVNCCKGHSRCEWLENHFVRPSKCGWFGDELTRTGPKIVLRCKDCLTEKVPSKEEVENEQ
jgi:hypothetical protein